MPLVFSLVLVATVFLGAALIGLRIRPRVVLAGCLGLIGVAMVFSEQLSHFEATGAAVPGLGYAFAGTLALALGGLAVARNHMAGLPIVETATLGMAYGAAFTFVVSVVLGGTVA